jgi:hypothetical protein
MKNQSMKNQSMKNQSMKNQSMKNQSMKNQSMGINPWIYPWEIQKKPLSGLLSNIFVFFDFLDEFFHEDQ